MTVDLQGSNGSPPTSLEPTEKLGLPGTRIHDIPELRTSFSTMAQLLNIAYTTRSEETRRDSLQAAAAFGSIVALEGMVFVVRVGPLSRVSRMRQDEHEEVWCPLPISGNGLVIGGQFTPLDYPVESGLESGSLYWNFGTAALAVLRYAPAGDTSLLTRPHARVHLGEPALNGNKVSVLPVAQIKDHQRNLHPLCHGDGKANPSQFVA